MALSLVQVYVRSAWRARAVFVGGSPSAIAPLDFTVTRQDGGPTTAVVAALTLIDVNSLELSFTERLIAKIAYVVTWGGQSGVITYIVPAKLDPAVQRIDDDPDAEANGIDLAWISGDPGPGGDCQRRQGIACVEYDLPNRAVLIPGELVQDPSAGGGLGQRVNSSPGDSELLQIAGRLEAEFKRDERVKDAKIDTSATTSGDVNFDGQVQTYAGQAALVRSS